MGLNRVSLDQTKSWYRAKGPDNDVVLSSRVRLSRNLLGHCFPHAMTQTEEGEVQQKVIRVFGKLPFEKKFTIIYLDDMSPIKRKLLLEKKLISQEFSIAGNKAIITTPDESLSIMINEEDHLRICAILTGLDLKQAYNQVNTLDTALEEYINYAVSLEWGYLNTAIKNIGTGMRVSVIMHLPALVITSLINKTLKTISQIGFYLKGFFGDEVKSLGDMYQISNQITIGESEDEIIQNLDKVVRQIIDYERQARREILERQKIDIMDNVFRALGILKYCQSISIKEAIDLLSKIRLGICLNILEGIELEIISTLLFMCQKYHIQSELVDAEEADNKLIDHTRALFIRDVINKVNICGGNHV